jgi:EmrB/QacA subfamily drug resistance transporter
MDCALPPDQYWQVAGIPAGCGVEEIDVAATVSSRTTAWIVVLTGIGSLMAALDTLVVAGALTTIHADLHASVEQLEWTVNGYNLSFAVLMIAGAGLADRFGRRRVYACGLSLFALASALCALAPNVGTLVAARVVQGAGAALILPVGLALLSAAFPPDKRGAALGLFSAITGISVAVGPLVGGAVVQGLAWQWIFWLNVPIGAVAAILTVTRLPESFGSRSPLDVRGLALITVGAFGLVWGLVRGNDAGWSSAEIVGALVGGATVMAGFVVFESRARNAMIPMRLFRSRAFSAGNAAIFCTTAALFAAVFFFAQYLQSGLGYGPFAAGLRLLPWTATFISVAPIAGALADRIGERPLMTTGLALQAIGLGWVAWIASDDIAYTHLLAPLIVAGVGASLAIPAAQNSVLGSVAQADIGKAAGANSMMRELGGVFGVAVTVAVFSGAGHYGSAHAFTDGFRPAILTAAVLSAAGAVAASMLPARRRSSVIAEAPQHQIVAEAAEVAI